MDRLYDEEFRARHAKQPTPRGESLDGRSAKYVVSKADGSPVDPAAKYLVLRIDNKPKESAEWNAMQAYLLNLDMDGRTELADHLRAFFGVENDPLCRLAEEGEDDG